jgi:N,N'-diacetyllegionaminate synthase|tara:strand:- start:607 stop:1644 length:1038 start_codon:yes stop_codon:yes gene_type:complete
MSYLLNKNKTLLIAEVGQAHEGSFAMACSFIEAAAKNGADAIKFQTHFADEESSYLDEFRYKPLQIDDFSRLDYWRRMEFTDDQWKKLRDLAKKLGILFISSPFSMKAFKLLKDLKIDCWKIASGEFFNFDLISNIVKTKKPIFLSTGMSTYEDISKLFSIFKFDKNNFCLMQCTSEYPCKPENLGFNVLKEYEERFKCLTGFSDHSGTIFPSLVAASYQACAVEVHVCFDKDIFGFDASSSITFDELKILSDGIKFINSSISKKVDKSKLSLNQKKLKKLFLKSAYLKKDVSAGDKISMKDIKFLKPAVGITHDDLDKYLKYPIRKSLKKDSPLEKKHFQIKKS